MGKARSELGQVLKSCVSLIMEESDIPKLPYPQAVIKESWRLHSAFLFPRKAETQLEIWGFKLPKDTQVLINLWAIGKEQDLWPNPTRFQPERFLDSDSTGREFDFIPFGAGRRMCPAMPLAWKMVPFLLGSLLHSFNWKLVDGERPESLNMDEKLGLTLPWP